MSQMIVDVRPEARESFPEIDALMEVDFEWLPQDRRYELYSRAQEAVTSIDERDDVDTPVVLLRKSNTSLWLRVPLNPVMRASIVGDKPFSTVDIQVFPDASDVGMGNVPYDTDERRKVVGSALPDLSKGIGMFRRATWDNDQKGMVKYSQRLWDSMMNIRRSLILHAQTHHFVSSLESARR